MLLCPNVVYCETGWLCHVVNLLRAGKSLNTFRSTRTLTHAAQMLEAPRWDPQELETASPHTCRELQRLPPAAGCTHYHQSQFTARTLPPASPGELPFVVHSSWIPWFTSRHATVESCTPLLDTMQEMHSCVSTCTVCGRLNRQLYCL